MVVSEMGEQTAGNDRADSQSQGDTHCVGHGQGDGHTQGPDAPGAAGGEGHHHADQEQDGGDQRRGDRILHYAGEELADIHGLGQTADAPRTHEDHNDLHHAGRTLRPLVNGTAQGNEL